MSRQYRVSWINGPDGRVIESYRRELRSDAEFIVKDLFPKIGEDELLVFEVADGADGSELGTLTCPVHGVVPEQDGGGCRLCDEGEVPDNG